MVGRLVSDTVIFEGPGREEWMDQSACLKKDPNLFFPSKTNADQVREAKAVCDDCPVRIQCLAKALVDEKKSSRRSGIFGGQTAYERAATQEMLDNMQKAQASANQEQGEETNG